VRRGGLGARRLDPGPGDRPLLELQQEYRLSYFSSPTTSRWSSTSATASR
jgi:hypothetical protein